jgi:hypothetical protein
MAGKARLGIAGSVVLATALTSAVCAEPAPASPTRGVGIDPGLMLGGARTVAVDLLWLRADLRRAQGHTLELPKNPLAWEYHAEVLIANLPLTAADEPDGGWRYLREGLELLQRGRLHHPDNERLTFSLALHASRIVSERPAAWRARAAEVFGNDPLIAAAAMLAPFATDERFEPRDAILLKIILTRLAQDAEALDRPDEAAALRAKVAALQAKLDALGEGALPSFEHTHEHDHDHDNERHGR